MLESIMIFHLSAKLILTNLSFGFFVLLESLNILPGVCNLSMGFLDMRLYTILKTIIIFTTKNVPTGIFNAYIHQFEFL